MAERSPPTSDAPGFEDLGIQALTPATDLETEKLKQDTIRKLERQQIEKDMKPADAEVEVKPIPVELPTLFFRYGSRVIGCEKFNTDADENRMIAKHLTVIFGKMDSRIFSVFIILVIIVGKIVACKDAIMAKLGMGKKSEEPKQAYRKDMDEKQDDQTKMAEHQNKVQKAVAKLTGQKVKDAPKK